MGVNEIKKRMNRVCGAVLLFIGILSGIQTLQMLDIRLFDLFFENDSISLEIFENIFSGFSYLAAYVFAIIIFKRIYRFDYRNICFDIKLGSHPVAMIFSSLGIIFTASHISSYFGLGGSGVPMAYHDQSIVLLLFTSAIIPAFCEELFFRGLIMTNLMPLGRNFAIIASGIIFGLVHGNHDQILFATIAGIVFGWLYAETGSIWCGVIIHLFNNLIALTETVLIGTLRYTAALKLCSILELTVLICGIISILYLIPKLKCERAENFSHGCFGSVTNKLLDRGVHSTFSEYLKGFFSPSMIIFLCYVALSEIAYVQLF